MSRNSDTPRDLLFGLLALQNGLILLQQYLASSYHNIGLLQSKAGHPDDAVQLFEKSLVIRERINSPVLVEIYDTACLLALISALSKPDSKRAEAGDRAMATLRRAVSAGYRDVGQIARDTDLDALRSRADFQLLMLDLAFPSYPFVGPQ